MLVSTKDGDVSGQIVGLSEPIGLDFVVSISGRVAQTEIFLFFYGSIQRTKVDFSSGAFWLS